MPLKPAEWSVVVVGRWNRAILTPAGLGKRVFKVPEGTPLEVMVAIDAIAPPQVKYGGMLVIAGSDRLLVQPTLSTFEKLTEAFTLARNALEELPETPVIAVGFNVKYQTGDYVEAIDGVLATDLDDRASDAGYEIADRGIHRSMKRQNGKVNISATQDEGGMRSVMINFDLKSDDPLKHQEWLNANADSVKEEVKRVVQEILKIPEAEIEYESQDRADNNGNDEG